MRRVVSTLSAVALISACTTVSSESVDDRTLSYGCSDIVVVGRVENDSANQASYSSDDLIGHDSFSAELRVRRVVSGSSIPASLPVKYFAHTYIRGDRDFMFVLTPVDGGYAIATAQLMSNKPRAVRCCP